MSTKKVSINLSFDMHADAVKVAAKEGHKTVAAYIRELLVQDLAIQFGSPLQEYWDRCDKHDWFYELSDDHGVWKRGEAAQRELRLDATSCGQTYIDIYDSFMARARASMRGMPLPPLIARPR